MTTINLPDIEGPTEQLCWAQNFPTAGNPAPKNAMARCDRKKGHGGPHTWEMSATIATLVAALEQALTFHQTTHTHAILEQAVTGHWTARRHPGEAEVSNLIEEIQKECNRVREAIPHYEAIGPAGMFGATMLKIALKNGEASIAEHDVVKMVKALAELRECAE